MHGASGRNICFISVLLRNLQPEGGACACRQKDFVCIPLQGLRCMSTPCMVTMRRTCFCYVASVHKNWLLIQPGMGTPCTFCRRLGACKQHDRLVITGIVHVGALRALDVAPDTQLKWHSLNWVFHPVGDRTRCTTCAGKSTPIAGHAPDAEEDV